METPTLSKRTTAFGIAVAIACVANAVIVIIKEKSDAVMKGLKSVLGHHWTTHSAIVVALFLVLGLIFSGRASQPSASRLIQMLVTCVVVATVMIVGFYLFVD